MGGDSLRYFVFVAFAFSLASISSPAAARRFFATAKSLSASWSARSASCADFDFELVLAFRVAHAVGSSAIAADHTVSPIRFPFGESFDARTTAAAAAVGSFARPMFASTDCV